MPVDVVLPRLSEAEDEALIVAWFKQPGATVTAGELLLEVQVEKVDYEIEAPQDGILREILVPAGDVAGVDQILGRIDEVSDAGASSAPAAPGQTAPTRAASLSPSGAEPFVPLSPAARRLAKEHGVDLSELRGSGAGGRITEADVRQLLERPAIGETPASRETEQIPIVGTRKTVADRMLASLQTTAQLTLTTEADVTELVRAREAHRAEVDATYTDLVAWAVTRALGEHPRLNATASGAQISVQRRVHLAVAVALEDGLVAPVVRDADRKNLREIAAESQRLAERARTGQLEAGELAGGTFTLSNLGTYDIDAFTPILNAPQVAILGVGRIVQKPAVHEETIAVRSMITLSLTFDHRAVDGAPAAAFLQAVSRRLVSPAGMFD